jgi:CO/xanthine dehydrogenase FAD-binding subunit
VLDASVELTSLRGTRSLPLQSFISGNRHTVIEPNEILTAIVIPDTGDVARTSFLKLGARRYLVISIVMVAALVELDAGGGIARAAVAVGSASPVAQRLPALEVALRGLPKGTVPSSRVTAEHLATLSPIDDVRATAAYRLDAAATLVGEALDRAAGVSPGV